MISDPELRERWLAEQRSAKVKASLREMVGSATPAPLEEEEEDMQEDKKAMDKGESDAAKRVTDDTDNIDPDVGTGDIPVKAKSEYNGYEEEETMMAMKTDKSRQKIIPPPPLPPEVKPTADATPWQYTTNETALPASSQSYRLLCLPPRLRASKVRNNINMITIRISPIGSLTYCAYIDI